MSGHVHIFIGYQPAQSLPEMMRDIKAGTSGFINGNKWMPGRFQWQESFARGFGRR
jgi:REP element-mobilizing transposase RayT